MTAIRVWFVLLVNGCLNYRTHERENLLRLMEGLIEVKFLSVKIRLSLRVALVLR